MDYELQSQLLINALKEAEGQRAVRMPEAKMQGNYAILPGAGNTLDAGFNRILGNFQKPRVEQQMAELRGQERGDYDRLLNELTTPGTKQVMDNSSAQGPLPEPVARNVPLNPLEESRRRMGVYGQMSRLPMAKAMADKGIASEVDFPEKQAMREQTIAAAQEQARQRAEDQFRADRARAEDRNMQIQMQLEGRKDLTRLAAAMRPPAAPHQRQTVTTDQGVLEWDGSKWSPIMVGDNVAMKAPTGTGGGKGMSAAKEKAANATKSLLSTVNLGLGLVDESTSGAGDLVPGAIRQMYTTPTTKIADSTIGQLSAEKAHELYGAAFTAAEMSRADSFLPAKLDSAETKKWKLGQMKILLEKKDAMLNGQPDPYPDMLTDILDPLSKGEMPVPRSALPQATGAGTRQTSGSISAVKQPSATDIEARKWADANPNDPRAAEILKRQGVR